ncbi:uncharacterized protein DUF4232 [Prauserella shujinwangii]|uniref:Uncharacterized protein DUF4232 n=1 Tax=Prauserella shujinwangii TaxID=1453103 RepID=A0A2T0LL95_9PSEU|nr:DUF4232 domain-containing protein [Prauserella shujinwangii]PRX43713.1 uncharacterized protein DUF4232 [Prauserella shujinwangii]
MKPSVPRGAAALLAGTAALALTGCGTVSPRTADPAGEPLPPFDDQLPECNAAILDGRVTGVTGVDGAAAERRATLRVVNTGVAACHLEGYGDLQLVGPDGGLLPTVLHRVGNEPRPTVLDPGDRAAQELRWSTAAAPGEPGAEACQPAPEALLVTPPDGTATFRVDWPAGAVCQYGRFAVTEYHEVPG